MKTPDDYLKTSDAERRRLRLRKRFRRYKKQVRSQLSQDDMLTYLRERQIRSCRALDKKRKADEPNTNDFRKVFGSWNEAQRKAFGSDIAVDMDGDYILKVVFDLGLWSVAKFKSARKFDPVSIPSWYQVYKTWGSYRNLLESAKRKHLLFILSDYRKLMRKLGHIPSIDDLRSANLRMDEAIKFYGGKKQMDEFIMSLEGKK